MEEKILNFTQFIYVAALTEGNLGLMAFSRVEPEEKIP
jgi:hypothetical protein